MEKIDKVLVYGTLKRGLSNNYLLLMEELLGETTTVDNFCIIGSGVPFAVNESRLKGLPSNAVGRLRGEVYSLNHKDSLRQLDVLESEGSLYDRVIVETNDYGEVYLYTPTNSVLESLVSRGSSRLVTSKEGEVEW